MLGSLNLKDLNDRMVKHDPIEWSNTTATRQKAPFDEEVDWPRKLIGHEN